MLHAGLDKAFHILKKVMFCKLTLYFGCNFTALLATQIQDLQQILASSEQ